MVLFVPNALVSFRSESSVQSVSSDGDISLPGLLLLDSLYKKQMDTGLVDTD